MISSISTDESQIDWAILEDADTLDSESSDDYYSFARSRISIADIINDGFVNPPSQTFTPLSLPTISPSEAAQMQYGDEQCLRSRLQQYYVENRVTSFRIRLFNLFIKILSCILYCIRVVTDEGQLPKYVQERSYGPSEIKYDYLIWVDRKYSMWICQVIVAIVSMIQTVVIFYLSYRGSVFRLVLQKRFLLELMTSMPLIATIFVPLGRKLYVPIFLNCWVAKSALQAILNDLNRLTSSAGHSALVRQMVILFSTLVCLVFTGTCGIEHLQRGGERSFGLFTSFYFVMVTFSTVGYGDWYPDTWMSRLYVVVLICIAFAILPKQIEALGQTYLERQKAGGDYVERWARHEKHVVVTITHLEAEFILDFLSEFFAHSEHQNHLVILLSPCEMDERMRMLLKIPVWSARVIYVRGSVLKDEDLERARMSSALACFILSARHIHQKNRTDEHTILRSWAVKDFAPYVPQYVQIFRPETKMHIEHAEAIVCEDEFKYSLLANNCICPGISTFITLLIHTSRGEEGQKSPELWHKVSGFHSGNEIYHIKIMDSKFFGTYINKSFIYASFHAHKIYGVGLIGVRRSGPGGKIQLNPGHNFTLQSGDTLYYIALTNEESLFNFRRGLNDQRRKANVATTLANIGAFTLDISSSEPNEDNVRKKRVKKRRIIAKKTEECGHLTLQVPVQDSPKRLSIGEVIDRASLGQETDDDGDDDDGNDQANQEDQSPCTVCSGHCIAQLTEKAHPMVTSYIGTGFTVCHMLKKKRPSCCLEIASACEHCNYRAASEYQWNNPPIIVAVDHTCSGLYNLIVPLRAYYRPVHDLQPIILLLELEHSKALENLLKAGISQANNVVVVKEGSTAVEEHLADCNTIIVVQKIHRMFPKLRVITELSHYSNMRFLHFNADDEYALKQSRYEKKERKRGSNMPFMFRLPFAQGSVFSANMLDRLLYQAVVKDYVVDFIRLMLGIDQSTGSGYLSCIEITADDLWVRTYGRLYQQLCSSVGDIPIGIYRTVQMNATDEVSIEIGPKKVEERQRNNFEISKLVRNGMERLGIPSQDYGTEYNGRRGTISYVIINPSVDMGLETGDIIYVLRSPVAEDASHQRVDPRRALQRPNSTEFQLTSTGEDNGFDTGGH